MEIDMTAPATPAAPATPVAAPFVTGDQAAVLGTMEKTIAATKAQIPSDPVEITEDADPQAVAGQERQRGPDGKFVKTEDVVVAQGQQAPAEEAADAPPEVVIPEGHVAVPALAEDKARSFKVRDAEGEIVPPDLTWELTANGKPRTLTTDKLVSYAQMGVYNQEREQAYQQIQHQERASQEKIGGYEQLLRTADQHIGRLLSDPDYLIQHIQSYEARNTPEARQQAERQRFEAERQQFQIQQMGAQATQFVDAELAPALEQIAAVLPSITREELGAKLLLNIDRYRVNGVLDPRHFQAVRDAVSNELVPWARQVHESRLFDKSESTKAADAAKREAEQKVKAAQVQAQKAKRQMALRPGGQGSPGKPDATPKPHTRRAVEDAVIGNTLAAMPAG